MLNENGDTWVIEDRADRGKLSDQRQLVRGDTGKWSNAALLLPAPSLTKKPTGMSLDDWIDALTEEKPPTTVADENWLLFRTRQLDDNDRVWIEKVERNGDEFTITMHEAIWQGIDLPRGKTGTPPIVFGTMRSSRREPMSRTDDCGSAIIAATTHRNLARERMTNQHGLMGKRKGLQNDFEISYRPKPRPSLTAPI